MMIWFEETFAIIVNVENSCLIFLEKLILFTEIFDEGNVKKEQNLF